MPNRQSKDAILQQTTSAVTIAAKALFRSFYTIHTTTGSYSNLKFSDFVNRGSASTKVGPTYECSNSGSKTIQSRSDPTVSGRRSNSIRFRSDPKVNIGSGPGQIYMVSPLKADLHLAARTVRLAFTSLQFDWIISDERRANVERRTRFCFQSVQSLNVKGKNIASYRVTGHALTWPHRTRGQVEVGLKDGPKSLLIADPKQYGSISSRVNIGPVLIHFREQSPKFLSQHKTKRTSLKRKLSNYF